MHYLKTMYLLFKYFQCRVNGMSFTIVFKICILVTLIFMLFDFLALFVFRADSIFKNEKSAL